MNLYEKVYIPGLRKHGLVTSTVNHPRIRIDLEQSIPGPHGPVAVIDIDARTTFIEITGKRQDLIDGLAEGDKKRRKRNERKYGKAIEFPDQPDHPKHYNVRHIIGKEEAPVTTAQQLADGIRNAFQTEENRQLMNSESPLFKLMNFEGWSPKLKIIRKLEAEDHATIELYQSDRVCDYGDHPDDAYNFAIDKFLEKVGLNPMTHHITDDYIIYDAELEPAIRYHTLSETQLKRLEHLEAENWDLIGGGLYARIQLLREMGYDEDSFYIHNGKVIPNPRKEGGKTVIHIEPIHPHRSKKGRRKGIKEVNIVCQTNEHVDENGFKWVTPKYQL